MDKSWFKRSCEADAAVLQISGVACTNTQVQIVAMGSYGRREMARFSDVDLLVLVPDDYSLSSKTAGKIFRTFQEEIPRLSLVIRSVSECVAMIDTDIRSWLSLLEARHVAGLEYPLQALRQMIHAQVETRGLQVVLKDAADYFSARRSIYGDTRKLLEPNIKNSAGSLRDIHALYYAALLMQYGYSTRDTDLNPPLFSDSVQHLPVSENKRMKIVEAWLFQQDTRESMHTRVGHLHDTLEYDLQRYVAEDLGYGQTSDKLSVERFMRQYYGHAKVILGIYDAVFACVSAAGGEKENSISKISDVFSFFLQCAQQGSVPNSAEKDRIEELIAIEEKLDTDENRVSFDTLLRLPAHVGKTLRIMNETGALGCLVPEFGKLAQYFQHNIYHFYTADEHTLIALENCEKLATDPTLLGRLYRSFSDPSVLFYAILFHDIAKPVDLAKHEIVGAEMARRILDMFHREDIAEDVSIVVRHHLLMEQTAFRRNYHDRATLLPFARAVGTDRRLAMLYIVTYADLSALNPNVWTEWKSAVLRELYEYTKAALNTGLDVFEKEIHEIRAMAAVAPAAQTERNGEGEWVTRDVFEVQEAEDVRDAIEAVEKGSPCRVVFRRYPSYSEAVVIAPDAPFLLSNIAAVILDADASIIDARIETRVDGLAVDTFRITDIVGRNTLAGEQENTIREGLRLVLEGKSDTEDMFLRHRRKWRRILRKNEARRAHTDVQYHAYESETGVHQTIIDVFAPDTLGLLYRLTQKISLFRLSILNAKIATRVDGVVDSFYVADVDGMPFEDSARQQELREALLQQIHLLTSPESDPSLRV